MRRSIAAWSVLVLVLLGGAGRAEHDHANEEAAHASPSAAPSPTPHDHQHGAGKKEGGGHGGGEGHGHRHGSGEKEEGEHAGGHGHDHGAEEELVTLTPEAVSNAGIKVVAAMHGRISHAISLTGVVAVNDDMTVHITPKVEGLVREVKRTLGDRVTAGEALVVLDSNTLGTAKVEFLQKQQEWELAKAELARKTEIHANVETLVALLKKHVAPFEIERKTSGLSTGEHRGKLMPLYSTLRLTKAAFEREERLYKRRVTSQKEFLEARKEYETAQAEYGGALDQVTYTTKIELITAQRGAATHEMAYRASERQLQVLGVAAADLDDLRSGKATDLSAYTIRSPIDGTITEKHVTLGERAGSESSLFTISNLTNVWVLGDVYEKDIPHVSTGMPAAIEVGAIPGRKFSGKVSVVSPALDPKTRTSRVRITVDNADRALAAGMFVKVETTTGAEEAVLSVPVAALQESSGKTVVFVRESETKFRPQEVTVGARDSTGERVEVFSGLKEGDKVVVAGSFLLRSEMAKGEMGHDHAH